MLERIKTAIFASYNAEERKGIFFSWFDAQKWLVFSDGVVHTDAPLHELIERVFTQSVQWRLDEIRYLAADIISEIIEIKNQEDIWSMSPKEFWFLVVDVEDDNSGVMLPNMSGVDDVKTVLYNIKQKYGIHGKVEIYVFRTERFIVAK